MPYWGGGWGKLCVAGWWWCWQQWWWPHACQQQLVGLPTCARLHKSLAIGYRLKRMHALNSWLPLFPCLQVGSFPNWDIWAEWNGKYRDDVRRFIKGDEGGPSTDCARAHMPAPPAAALCALPHCHLHCQLCPPAARA